MKGSERRRGYWPVVFIPLWHQSRPFLSRCFLMVEDTLFVRNFFAGIVPAPRCFPPSSFVSDQNDILVRSISAIVNARHLYLISSPLSLGFCCAAALWDNLNLLHLILVTLFLFAPLYWIPSTLLEVPSFFCLFFLFISIWRSRNNLGNSSPGCRPIRYIQPYWGWFLFVNVRVAICPRIRSPWRSHKSLR